MDSGGKVDVEEEAGAEEEVEDDDEEVAESMGEDASNEVELDWYTLSKLFPSVIAFNGNAEATSKAGKSTTNVDIIFA